MSLSEENLREFLTDFNVWKGGSLTGEKVALFTRVLKRIDEAVDDLEDCFTIFEKLPSVCEWYLRIFVFFNFQILWKTVETF